MKVASIWIKNRGDAATEKKQMGDCHIRIGDYATEFTTNNPTIAEDIADGGLFENTNLLSGRYLTLRRNTQSSRGDNWSSFRKIKAYQVPNLVKVYENNISFTSDTSSAVENYKADNLIENLEMRSSGNDLPAGISDTPYETLTTQNTCFKAKYETIKAQNNKMIIGLNFSESVFIHAIMHA